MTDENEKDLEIEVNAKDLEPILNLLNNYEGRYNITSIKDGFVDVTFALENALDLHDQFQICLAQSKNLKNYD